MVKYRQPENIKTLRREVRKRLKSYESGDVSVTTEEWSRLTGISAAEIKGVGGIDKRGLLTQAISVLSHDDLNAILDCNDPFGIFESLKDKITSLEIYWEARLSALQVGKRDFLHDIWEKTRITALKELYDNSFSESDDWCRKHRQYLESYRPCEPNQENLENTEKDLERINNLLIIRIRDGYLQKDKTRVIDENIKNKYKEFFQILEDNKVPDNLIDFMRFNFHQNGFSFRINSALQQEVTELYDDCIITVDNQSRYFVMKLISDGEKWKIRIHDHMVYPGFLISTASNEPRKELKFPITVQHIYDIESKTGNSGDVVANTVAYLPMTEHLHNEIKRLCRNEVSDARHSAVSREATSNGESGLRKRR